MYRSRVSPAKKNFARLLKRRATEPEKKLRRLLNAQSKYRFQFQSIVGGWVLDFYSSRVRVAVEIDGSSHDGRERQDENRDAVLRKTYGIVTLRFSNEAVLRDPANVYHQIEAFCDAAPKYKTWNEGRKKNARD